MELTEMKIYNYNGELWGCTTMECGEIDKKHMGWNYSRKVRHKNKEQWMKGHDREKNKKTVNVGNYVGLFSIIFFFFFATVIIILFH